LFSVLAFRVVVPTVRDFYRTMTPFQLSVHFFLQVAAVLVACKAAGWLGKRCLGQPQVVCEMIAGVLLGPSLFGHLWPEGQAWLFPAQTRGVLFTGAQVGLALYMFCVGLEFRVDLIRAKARSAAAISFSGIAVPFGLGCAVAWWLHGHGGFFSEGVDWTQALPFTGAAMAITAFPMLARIIVENRLSGTSTGTLALAAGALDDAAAWLVLALVLASLGGDASIAVKAVGGGVLFIVLVFLIVRPGLRRLAARVGTGAVGEPAALSWLMILLMLAAWFTDVIGLYAVFGAFFLGMAVPRGQWCDQVRATVEPLTVALLLPLFFIYSGLNTRIDLVNTGFLWLVTGVVLVAAIAGKGVACYVAARWHGESRANALGIGTLMNARGLMELIILNIGLERGIISVEFFTVMVLMAVATTLMATPIFRLLQRRGAIT
jgi:Kef-type K+ transport system membrane component KefB